MGSQLRLHGNLVVTLKGDPTRMPSLLNYAVLGRTRGFSETILHRSPAHAPRPVSGPCCPSVLTIGLRSNQDWARPLTGGLTSIQLELSPLPAPIPLHLSPGMEGAGSHRSPGNPSREPQPILRARRRRAPNRFLPTVPGSRLTLAPPDPLVLVLRAPPRGFPGPPAPHSAH